MIDKGSIVLSPAYIQPACHMRVLAIIPPLYANTGNTAKVQFLADHKSEYKRGSVIFVPVESLKEVE